MNWFDHHLRGASVSTGPQFAYFRPWVGYTGIATPAYATSSSFPVGTPRTYRFSGANQPEHAGRPRQLCRPAC